MNGIVMRGSVRLIDGNGMLIDRLMSNEGIESVSTGNVIVGRLSEIEGIGIDTLNEIPSEGSERSTNGSVGRGKDRLMLGICTENGSFHLQRLMVR